MSFDKGRDIGEDVHRRDMEKKHLELLERQVALQEDQAKALSTQVDRSAPKDNPHFVAVGPYNAPDGTTWASKLKCDIYDGPIHLNDGGLLTEAEAKQLNRLLPLERGLVTKTDRSQARARVVPSYDAQGKLMKLVIERPMGRDDNAQHFPPLDEMARQLADQAMPKEPELATA